MKRILYDFVNQDDDFKNLYKRYNKNKISGFKSFAKRNIDVFVSDFNIFLDKPYLDVSYLKVKDKLIDLDLLYDIFKNYLEERRIK